MRYIPKLQTAWSPLTLTPEKEQAAQKLIQQRALQGYNTSGVNWLKETPEITSKRKALASKQQTEYQNKRFANRTNEVPVLGMPAATQIGLKNVHPEFALMTGGVGSGMTGIKGAMGYGAIQGGLWNSAGIAGEQNLGGLAGDVIGGGIAGGVIKVASPYVKKGVQNIYKINPFAEKLVDKNASYRIAGYDAYQDFLTSGVVRSGKGAHTGHALNGVEIIRPTSFPSFQKGFADKKYLQKGMNNVIFKTKVPTFARGERNPVTGNIIRGSHYAHRPIDMNTGEVIKELPGNLVEVFSQNPHWLKGYQKTKILSKSIVGQNSELVRPITPTFWQDMYNATKQGIIESREVISNPVVQNTIRKNIETYKRLKPQAVVNDNLGEIMQNLSKRKIHPKFTELDDVTSGQLVDHGGETVDGYFNTQSWNALKPLQHHEATGFHEGLHIGRFGSYPIARDKVNRLYKPNSEWINKDNASYILDNISGEGVVNTYEMGKRAGLKIGQSYPGIDKFKEMLQNTNFGEKTEFANMLKLDTPRDYKRVWDAMTGKYFVAPITMAAGYKLTQNNKE